MYFPRPDCSSMMLLPIKRYKENRMAQVHTMPDMSGLNMKANIGFQLLLFTLARNELQNGPMQVIRVNWFENNINNTYFFKLFLHTSGCRRR